MEQRDRKITVRYTTSELEQAKLNANGQLAVWLRELSLLQKPKRQAKPVNHELLYELNKIGVNLNQITRTLNAYYTDADKALAFGTLAEIQRELTELRKKYDR